MRGKMEKRVLWDNGIKDYMKEFTSEHMLEFMELLDYIKDDGIESIINRNTQEDPDLWDWLYTKDQTEMNDIKKELGKKYNGRNMLTAKNYYMIIKMISVYQQNQNIMQDYEDI